jgi:hydroxypyruvate isomerase
LKIIRAVKSPWFGVNFDSGNFHGDDIYGELARIAPYALNCQIKVVVSGPDRKKVPSDFGLLAKILTDAGYRGYIVLEYEEDEDPRVACPRYLEQMREAFG